ncbi:RstC protein [Aliivibrio kagoshimensis]|uniref:RstC protein n=1 Tax=Aliivibrio kagoshimensis TaxID=2910230 RepID=UPI003D0D7103
MTTHEYTLNDVEQKLDIISNISIFLNTESCTNEIRRTLMDHLQNEIESMQGILLFVQTMMSANDEN